MIESMNFGAEIGSENEVLNAKQENSVEKEALEPTKAIDEAVGRMFNQFNQNV